MKFLKNFYNNYICLNAKDYLDIEIDFEINKILFFIVIGICTACFVITYYQNDIILLLKKLLKIEAFSEDSAKTLYELGLSENKNVKRMLLRNTGKINRIVSVVGRKQPTFEEYTEFEKQRKLAKKNKTPFDKQLSLSSIDFSSARLYISLENRLYAERSYSSNDVSYVKAGILSIAVFIFYLVIVYTMPLILEVISSFF